MRAGVFGVKSVVAAGIAALVTAAGPGGGSAQDGAAPVFSPMDVFELEYAADPQIAPDGSSVAYVRTSMDVMTDRRRSEIWRAGPAGHRRIASGSSPRWSPDGERLAYTSGGQIQVRWMATGHAATVTNVRNSPRNICWSPDGTQIAFNMLVPSTPPSLAAMPSAPRGAEWATAPVLEDRFKSQQDGAGYLPFGRDHLFVVPADGGTPRQVTSGDFAHSGAAAWTPDGSQLVFSANREPDWQRNFRDSYLYAVALADGGVKRLTNRPGPARGPAVSPDGRLVAYTGYADRMRTYQVSELWVTALDGSGPGPVSLTPDLDRSVSSPVWDPDGDGIYFQYDNEGNGTLAWVGVGRGGVGEGGPVVLARDLGGTSIGRPYGGGSFSVAAGGQFALNVTSPERPGDVARGSRNGGLRSVTRVTDLNQDLLGTRSLARVEEMWWESSFDGRPVQGWIALPPGHTKGARHPLILEIHGGPVSNYGDRFSAEVQLLAAAGYAVLYANPRGSTSYGEEFGDLLYRNYPGQDYDDLISGVDAAVEAGYADPEHLYVTGGSAGGIMTAWIVGTTDRFRAAVAQKPVINWISKTLTADNWYGYFESRYEGLPWDDPEPYWRFSPLSRAGHINTPTLIVTGEDDLRTPLSESYQLYHVLQYRGVDTGVVRLPGAPHDMSRRPSQLIGKIANILAWFDRYRARAAAD